MHGYMNVESFKKLLRLKRLITLVDLDSKFGTKVKLVALLKK